MPKDFTFEVGLKEDIKQGTSFWISYIFFEEELSEYENDLLFERGFCFTKGNDRHLYTKNYLRHKVVSLNEERIEIIDICLSQLTWGGNFVLVCKPTGFGKDAVMTDKGIILLEDISVGHKVLTEDGTFHSIKAITNSECKKEEVAKEEPKQETKSVEKLMSLDELGIPILAMALKALTAFFNVK